MIQVENRSFSYANHVEFALERLEIAHWRDRGYGSISGGEPKEVYTSQLVLEYQPQGVEQSQQAIESRNVFHGFGAAGWIQVEF